MKSVSKIALLLMVMVSLSGCAAVVVGGAAAGATYTYVKGWLADDYIVPLKHGYRACIEALKSHELKIIEKEKDINRAMIKAQGANREIWIRLKRVSKRVTRISVRFGLMGDQKASKLLHKTIRSLI